MAARVLLATGHGILLNGLGPRLLEEQGIRSVTAARTREEVLQALQREPIDVAVLHVGSAEGSEIELIGSARNRATPVACVALVDRPTGMSLERVIRAGAAGIVSTRSSARVLAEAVRRVHAKRCYVSTDVTNALISGSATRRTTSGRDPPLTVRERETLRLIADGCSSREIATELGISVRTVETYRARLMKKLGLRKTAALVRFAVREGLVAV